MYGDSEYSLTVNFSKFDYSVHWRNRINISKAFFWWSEDLFAS